MPFRHSKCELNKDLLGHPSQSAFFTERIEDLVLDMAIEPKTPRKRAAKKVTESSPETGEVTAKKSPSKKSAPAIPVPIFQAASVTDVKPARAPRAKAAVAD